MIPVTITPPAERDLESIADHIAADNPHRAETFVAELLRKAESIGHMPRAYPLRPGLGRNFRIALHGKYVIVFRAGPNEVFVLRIVHGARDLRGLLQE